MRTPLDNTPHFTNRILRGFVAVVLAAALWAGGRATAGDQEECDACKVTAAFARRAALAEASSDYWLELARGSTLPDVEERKAARARAREQYRENLELAGEQYRGRLELCERLEECRYHPVIRPEDFLTPAQIATNPNPYLPLVPGTTRRYQGQSDEGTEVIEVKVTSQTREILGVRCVVVKDTVRLNGAIVEDTEDWFTQDKNGNVWYFGERSFEYENGAITSLEGSWEAGADGAKPGIVMKAAPQVGNMYRQEFLLGEAEDAAEVLGLNESVTVPTGTYSNCLKTGEFTPLEPDFSEHKFYAPGVGLVLELNPETGGRVELIAIEIE